MNETTITKRACGHYVSNGQPCKLCEAERKYAQLRADPRYDHHHDATVRLIAYANVGATAYDLRAVDIRTCDRPPTLDERLGVLPVLVVLVLALAGLSIAIGWLLNGHP